MTEVLKLIYEAVRLRKLVRRIVQDSIPSVAANGALTIAPATWAEMFETVAPELALYVESLRSAVTQENLLPSDLEVAKRITKKPLSEDEALAAAEAEVDRAGTALRRMAELELVEKLARKKGWSERWDCTAAQFLEDLYG